MNQTNSNLVKPLALKIKRTKYPRFDNLHHIGRGYSTVSNLRVNRTLARRPTALEKEVPAPIRGERLFTPSEELQKRLARIQQVEEEISKEQPLEEFTRIPAEKREKQLKEARSTYESQIQQLKEREKELMRAVEEAESKLRQMQQKVHDQREKITAAQDLPQLLQKQKKRISELEAKSQNLQSQLMDAKKEWKEKVSHLEKLKKQAETASLEERKNLGRQIHEQQEKISALSAKKNELAQRIHKEEGELARLQDAVAVLSSQNKEKEELIRRQKSQLEELQRDKEKISRFANELVKKLAQVENLQRVEKNITVAKKPVKKEKYKPKIIKAVPKAHDLPPLTNKANAINGIVVNSRGSPQDNALVVIKNKDLQPQRALRTNKLGQFAVSAPLSNGTYRVEVQKDNLKFDIIELELKGEVLDPIEIKAVE
ncbi:hypothetical protein B5M47_00200 [candidate division CPR3 bacterium 4484_211]|uniref:Carboxypeptidase regulatory-like domain-containing protein n=1 Tax=candidate division CPR3 bacterium 4484_211 TaxID=1968527 RepID=A0A1W9NZP2_UNCC3|nr:MAG: hypothetical protein B5M47_00200 [candidate division CPR3 bacterium 4484_211]